MKPCDNDSVLGCSKSVILVNRFSKRDLKENSRLTKPVKEYLIMRLLPVIAGLVLADEPDGWLSGIFADVNETGRYQK